MFLQTFKNSSRIVQDAEIYKITISQTRIEIYIQVLTHIRLSNSSPIAVYKEGL